VTEELDRFLALVRRELGCEDARVLDAGDEGGREANALEARLPDGRLVSARFAEVPPDFEAKLRRLEMLVSTFDAVIDESQTTRRSRPPVTSSLHDELVALCTRSSALNAVVIDANSPIIWGAAQAAGLAIGSPDDSAELHVQQAANDGERYDARTLAASRRAVEIVRSWEDLTALRKGKRLRRIEREGDVPLVAHSFAGIYVLVLAFAGAFDELRAERAVLEALPRIERLVLALPPHDPAPLQGAGAVALRRPRKR
jgi:hypothetical protein